MAMVNCPECGYEKVSSLADKCPCCGYPIKNHFEAVARATRRNAALHARKKRNKAILKWLPLIAVIGVVAILASVFLLNRRNKDFDRILDRVSDCQTITEIYEELGEPDDSKPDDSDNGIISHDICYHNVYFLGEKGDLQISGFSSEDNDRLRLSFISYSTAFMPNDFTDEKEIEKNRKKAQILFEEAKEHYSELYGEPERSSTSHFLYADLVWRLDDEKGIILSWYDLSVNISLHFN